MSPVPRITVITPTQNRAVQLERAVRSVLTQTMGDFEYIVVDDGSTDDTEAKIAALDDPRLIYIRQSWQGANAARNAGIALARADLVTLLDSDDVFLPDRLERTVPLFADEAVELLISSFMTLKNGRLSNSVNRARRLDGAALERALVAQTIYIAGSAISVRRDTLVAVGSFDPAIARLQDRELLLRLSQRTGCLVSDRIDWQKNNTPNSISGARDGYIPAYDALVSKHPGVFQKYADLAGYMVARNILAHVMSGYLAQGLADYRSTRRSRALNYSLSHLISSYMRGRLQRREIRRQAMGRSTRDAYPRDDIARAGSQREGTVMEEIAIGLYAPKQTNTGLYVEMHELGHPIEDILRVKTAYSLCAKMFNGRYRKTGRPFLCHAVGAASSVAHFGGTVDQIIAAMFHATYDSGQFPDGRSGNRWDHPDWLRARLGPDVEGLVARLDEMSFEKGDPERMAAEDISAGDEDIVFMTLAHEVDDLADAGLFVAPKYGNNLDSRLAACAALARRVGNESMATVFEVYADRYPSWSWASALQEPKLEGFRIAPNLRAYLKLRREHRRGGGIEIL